MTKLSTRAFSPIRLTRRWPFWWAGLWLLAGCIPKLLIPEASVGTLAIHHYLALGDGYTAGFTNGDADPHSLKGLYAEGQQHAYPALLAGQFALLDSVDFPQHLAPGTGSGYRTIASVTQPLCGPVVPIYTFAAERATPTWERPPAEKAEVRNLGVPHLGVRQLASDSFGRTSLFFKRIHNSHHTNYQDLVDAQDLRCFTLWLGTTDVLAYAMSGGANPAHPATPVATFAHHYAALLERISQHPRPQGIIGNIPDVTRFPYFTEVSPQFVSVENCQGSLRPIYLTTGQGEVRTATRQDRILLPAKTEIGLANGLPGGLGLHPDNPLPSGRVLDAAEVAEVRALVQAYNAAIDSLIAVYNARRPQPWLARADLHTTFNLLAGGTTEDGLHLSAAYLTGGVFSLDGVYLTPRGNALITNTFIQAINQFVPFRARIPTLQVTAYPGVAFP